MRHIGLEADKSSRTASPVMNSFYSQLPNHGKSISLWVELNIKLAAYYVRHHLDRVSHDCDAASITLAVVRAVCKLKEYEENYKAPDEKPKIDDKEWPKMFESIDDYLARINGEQNLPLAYVIRRNTAVPPDEDDPSTNYPTAVMEMIAQAPHGTAATVVWTYVKNHVHSRDGCMAYYAMFSHYLGPNNVDNQASQSEKALTTLTYNGEGRRWNFEKYVTAMKKHHQILEDLVPYRYSGIDEQTKVLYLLDGIKTDKLEVPKSTILSETQY